MRLWVWSQHNHPSLLSHSRIDGHLRVVLRHNEFAMRAISSNLVLSRYYARRCWIIFQFCLIFWEHYTVFHDDTNPFIGRRVLSWPLFSICFADFLQWPFTKWCEVFLLPIAISVMAIFFMYLYSIWRKCLLRIFC